MNEPREQKSPAKAVRASDDERERVAKLISDAAGEGRLTLAEADERLNLIYATRFRHELAGFVDDLPGRDDEPADRRPAPGRTGLASVPVRLRVHAAVAVVLSVFLILRFVASDAPFFWPAGPMFFLFGSLIVHARVAYWSSRGATPGFRQWQLRPSVAQRYGDPAAPDESGGGHGKGQEHE